MFQQTDDVGGNEQRLTTNVEVDSGQRPRPELCRATEQRLHASLCRQIEDNDRPVFRRTDQLILGHTFTFMALIITRECGVVLRSVCIRVSVCLVSAVLFML